MIMQEILFYVMPKFYSATSARAASRLFLFNANTWVCLTDTDMLWVRRGV
jgi:hypothetical protein